MAEEAGDRPYEGGDSTFPSYPYRTYRIRDYPENYGGTPEDSMKIEVVVEMAREYQCMGNFSRVGHDVMNTMMHMVRSYGKFTECVVRFVDMDSHEDCGIEMQSDTF